MHTKTTILQLSFLSLCAILLFLKVSRFIIWALDQHSPGWVLIVSIPDLCILFTSTLFIFLLGNNQSFHRFHSVFLGNSLYILQAKLSLCNRQNYPQFSHNFVNLAAYRLRTTCICSLMTHLMTFDMSHTQPFTTTRH